MFWSGSSAKLRAPTTHDSERARWPACEELVCSAYAGLLLNDASTPWSSSGCLNQQQQVKYKGLSPVAGSIFSWEGSTFSLKNRAELNLPHYSVLIIKNKCHELWSKTTCWIWVKLLLILREIIHRIDFDQFFIKTNIKELLNICHFYNRTVNEAIQSCKICLPLKMENIFWNLNSNLQYIFT